MSGKRKKKNVSVFPYALVCFLIALAAALSCGQAHAARREPDTAREHEWGRRSHVVMVAGHIEDVTAQGIEVKGNYYDFAGAPIVNAHGQAVSQAQLIRGREVKLFFRRGVLNGIMVFEHPMVQ